MNNQTIQCRDEAGTICRVIRTIDRGEAGWAYELQLPSGERTIIEPPLTERYTIVSEIFSLQLGQVVATPGVLAAMSETGESPDAFLQRHQIGDWGELDQEDLHANELALGSGSRILSAYRLNDGTKIYVITEAVGDDGERHRPVFYFQMNTEPLPESRWRAPMSTLYHPSSVEAAINLLRSLGAPPRLVRHGEIVASVAGLLSDVIADLGVTHDANQVEIGAALHDAGKIIHLNELDWPGNQHETAGEILLLGHGVSPQIARFC